MAGKFDWRLASIQTHVWIIESWKAGGSFTNRRKLAFDARSQQSRQRHDTSVSSWHAHSVLLQTLGNIVQVTKEKS